MYSESSGTAPLLEMRNIAIEGVSGGQWQPILEDVSLTLYPGEILGLIGESGAGKSTLGLLSMGFIRAGCRLKSGIVRFRGEDVMALDEAGRDRLRGARITYVAQSASASFNPAFRLMDQVVESPVLHGICSRAEAEEDARGLFSALSLPMPERFGTRYPHQVSGGQLQRAMTAMAMAPRPDLIVFDEPTTALDVTSQVEVLVAMRDIVRRFNTAAIYITHDLAVVSQMADRIKVLRSGREVEEAPTREMILHPTADYTRTLWSVRQMHRPGRESGDIILSLTGVAAGYGPKARILEDVNMAFPRGCTTALVGESGSGKSTVARVISGLLAPQAGVVSFNGKPLKSRLRSRSREMLRRIQMIHQTADTAMNPRQRVREIIGRPLRFYFRRSRAENERRLHELIGLVGLRPDHLERFPSELSGGQKQRICIARALAAEPDLILCDEVTSALDQVVQKEILDLLSDLQARLGITYVFITHDLTTVQAIADRVVVMQAGRIVDQGSKAEVLSPPRAAYTRELLAAVPEIDPDWLDRLLAERAGTIPNLNTEKDKP